MAEIKTLADEIRSQIKKPATEKKTKKTKVKIDDCDILKRLEAFDNSGFKNMVHVRFDEKTAQTLNHLKMATEVDLTKVVAFAVQDFFDRYPELKSIIKQFIQNSYL